MQLADAERRRRCCPAEEPPVVRSVLQGLRVTPVRRQWQTPNQPNSGIVVWPTSTAPAERRCAAAGASKVMAS